MSVIRTNINDQFENIREYFSEIEKNIGLDLLDQDESMSLFKDYRENGNIDARNRLIHMNLRLVNKCALDLMVSRHELADLIQEGNIGLIKAIENYDYNSDIRFPTYAIKCIKQNIKRYMYSNKTIRIPEHLTIALSYLKRLESELGRPVTVKEAKKAIKMDKVNTENVLNISNMTIESYDYTDNEEGDSVLSKIADIDIKDFSKYIIYKETHNEIYGILSEILEERELFVITARFGLDGNEPKTLQEIGNMIKRTRELVRRIEMKSFEKIRKAFENNNMNYSDFINGETI